MPKPVDKKLAERVAARFIAKQASAPLDEKMKALFLKLRKGAGDSGMTIKQFSKIVEMLGGWRVEQIVGLTAIHYAKGSFKDEPDKELLQRIHHSDESAARAAYDEVKAHEVSALPANPKLGQLYVMGLEPFKSTPDPWEKGAYRHGAGYKLWVGVPGYRITDPNGKVFELLPSKHDVNTPSSMNGDLLPTIDAKALLKRLPMYDVMKWAREHTTWLDQINNALGMETHVPAAQRTRENTGSCGVCFRNIKLEQRGESLPTMALHGYNRPGYGYILGRCHGGSFPPYELSDEATKHELKHAAERLKSEQKVLAKLKDPDITSFVDNTGMKPKEHRKGDEFFALELKRAIERQKHAVVQAQDMHDIFEWLVKHWEPRELPKQGEPEVDWWTNAGRAVAKERGLIR